MNAGRAIREASTGFANAGFVTEPPRSLGTMVVKSFVQALDLVWRRMGESSGFGTGE